MTASVPVVLHVLEAIGGGTSRHLIDVVRHSPGIRHLVATPRRRAGGWLSDDAAIDELTAAGATVHIVDMRRTPWHPLNVIAALRIRGLIQRYKPDVVHGHSSVGGAIARVAAFGLESVRVYTPNGISTSRLAVFLERRLAFLTDWFVAVSESEAELAVRLRTAARDRTVVIPNGIDLLLPPPTTDLRGLLKLSESSPLVGNVSRLVPQKAPEVYIEACSMAAALLPDVHFLLIGDGLLARGVDSAIRRSGHADRIHRVAEVPIAASVLGQLDLYCLSSRFEGGPYTPLEAMRAGTPVVVTAAVGSRDVVVDGVSGLVVPVDEPAAIANAIHRLMVDKPLRRKLAEAGKARLVAKYDVRLMGEALADFYRRVSAR